MKVSFQNLWEQSSAGRDLWFSSRKDVDTEASREVIKRGLELRPEREDNTFWDDFIQIFSQNADDAAELLDVPRDAIARWSAKIKKIVEIVRNENDNSEKKKKEKNMIKTGINAPKD